MPSKGLFLVDSFPEDRRGMHFLVNKEAPNRIFPYIRNNVSVPDSNLIESAGLGSRNWGVSDIWWSYYNVTVLKRREE